MNLKINREPIKFSETICTCSQEQSVELDYVLPDYCPEIFRIVKCCAEPSITACTALGDRISYELTVCLRIIYCTEGSTQPLSVEQKLVYNRTVNTDCRCDAASVYITACTDHINCRAVNSRRIDVRGAVTVSVRASGEKETEVVGEAFGGGIQLKKVSRPCPSGIIRAQKRVTVSDEFDIGSDAPSIGTIIRAEAQVISTDKKLIAEKAAAKGELKISVVYTSPENDENDPPVHTMQFTLPFSQLIDLEGMDDAYDCRINTSVISCEITPRSDGDGNSRRAECEILLFIDCVAVKMSMYDIVCDEYSTSYATTHTGVPVKIAKDTVSLDCPVTVKGICESHDSPLSVIYDCWCSTSGLKAAVTNSEVTVSGKAVFSVMGRTENGDMVICTADVSVDETLACEASELSEAAEIKAVFSVLSCGYNFTSDNTAEVKAEIALRGWITDYDTVEAITEITLDEESVSEKHDDSALRLYFADKGETLWEISKKYGAVISRVIEENELDSDVLSQKRMLLIPTE